MLRWKQQGEQGAVGAFALDLVIVNCLLSLTCLNFLKCGGAADADSCLMNKHRVGPVIVTLSCNTAFVSTSTVINFKKITTTFNVNVR